MAKQKKISTIPEQTKVITISTDDLAPATGTEDSNLSQHLINQVMNVLWVPEDLKKEDQDIIFNSAISALKGIKPESEIEGMLAVQMIATHSAAMECLRRTMLHGQSFEGRDANFKYAAKLLGIFAKQIDTLNKNRGKGQQKVTVEHVHVERGGQAIVGYVETGGKNFKADSAKKIP